MTSATQLCTSSRPLANQRLLIGRKVIVDTRASRDSALRFTVFLAGMATAQAALRHAVNAACHSCRHRERGLAIATVMSRPSTLWPSRALIEIFASSGVAISTKPNPRDRPL